MRNSILVLICAAGLAIAGCGGGDDSSTTSTADDFVSQGNAICTEFNGELAGLQPPAPGDFEALAQFANDTIAAIQPAIAKFEALTPPEDAQDQWDTYLADVKGGVAVIQKLEKAAEAHDGQQVTALTGQLNQLNNDDEAVALGLTECAKDPGQ
jgi:hypothetical protein